MKIQYIELKKTEILMELYDEIHKQHVSLEGFVPNLRSPPSKEYKKIKSDKTSPFFILSAIKYLKTRALDTNFQNNF